MSILNKIRKSVFGLGGSTAFTLGWDTPFNGFGKYKQLQEYRRYVHAIVSAISEEVGRSEIIVKRNDKEIEQHPMLALLRNPNPQSSQFQFLEMHQTYMELCGESFWYLVFSNKVTNKPSEMYLLRPDMVDVVIADDEKGTVIGYTLNKPDGTKVPFEKDEIIHHKMPNPLNPYRGMSVVQAAQWFIQTEEFATDWTRNAIYNSGIPSGILSIKGTIDKDEFDSLKRRFRQEYSGTKNTGKTLVIKASEGTSYQKLGMELGDIALKELKDMSLADLKIMWRVSNTMLGIQEDVNRASAKEARAVWLQNVIQPKVWRLIDQLDSDLVQRYGDVELDFKSNVPADHEEAREDFKAGLLTVNEAREMIGEAEVKDGDIRFMPLNMVPVGQPRNQDKRKGFDEDRKLNYWKQFTAVSDSWVGKYQSAVNSIFKEQKKEILERNEKAFDDWKFRPSTAKWTGILLPITEELYKEQGKSALIFAGDDETEFIVSENMRAKMRERIELFASETDEETQKQIEETITDGVQAGDNLEKMRKRIEAVYTQATTVRSERIARTETLQASNQAALESYLQSPVVTGKEILVEPDGCEFCRAFEGKVIGLQEHFVNLGEDIVGVDGGEMTNNFTDIDAPPFHPNCRCALLPVTNSNFSLPEKIEVMERSYSSMDKRTKEAKKLLADIKKERAELKKDKSDMDGLLEDIAETFVNE